MEDVYSLEDYDVDWELPTLQPTILLAQLTSRLVLPPSDRGIRQADDPEYLVRLRAAAAALLDHRADFLVFPEYACPLRFWPEMLSALQHTPHGSVCILPFEHLRLGEFEHLILDLPASPTNRVLLDRVLDQVVASTASALVNVAMSIVSASDGIHFVPQPKLRPAAFEEPSHLGGRALSGGFRRTVISGRNCRFTTAICFDLIARDEARGTSPRDALAKCKAHFVFVPECNPQPLHQAYSRAISELYLQSAWIDRRTMLVICNCAAQTRVPGLDRGAFGYSRVFGQLGRVTPAQDFVFAVAEHETFVSDAPRSLADVVANAERSSIRPQSTLLFRSHESLIRLRVPTVGSGPSSDPTVERTNTEVLVMRRGPSNAWNPIRRLAQWSPPAVSAEMPLDLVVQGGLIAVTAAVEQFLQLLRGATPVWVVGDGGVGKTALTATALRDRVLQPRTARILWIDMAAVAPANEDVAETLLLAIGRTAALQEPLSAQWQALGTFFSENAVVVVLDSLERWGGNELPPEVLQFHRWPTRVVITSRREPDRADAGTVLRLAPLPPGPAAELVQRVAGRLFEGEEAEALYRCLQGSPLACVWVGGLLSADGRNQLFSGLWAAIRGDRIRTLEDLFQWCITGLSDRDLQVLGVLSALPAPVSVQDVARTLDIAVDAVKGSLGILRERNLVMRSGVGDDEVHTRHPFVRQFWDRTQRHLADLVWRQIVNATTADVIQHGGDRNWRGYSVLLPKWINVRHVLTVLSGATLSSDRVKFLELWRAVDYMLFARGLWHERVRLGYAALEAARAAGQRALEAHALFDAIAETEWHRQATMSATEERLNETARLYSELNSPTDVARVEYYRGRMLRHFGRLTEAVGVAEHAVNLARPTGDLLVLGAALNGFGNALRTIGRSEEALQAYSAALDVLTEARDEEMVAVVHRNRGRVALDLGTPHDAVWELEIALDAFADLELGIEEAETVVHHARAIAALGETDEAEFEVLSAAQRVAALGSKVRDSDLADARRWIESCRQQT
jgi:tetratricopeptide (TPR) repeat protein/predicted amidohydrolase/predicted transcriptional regulator